MPFTVIWAESLTVTEPVPIETSGSWSLSASSIAVPSPFFGVVVIDEPHCWNWPNARSLSWESSERPVSGPDEERVSAMNVGKHVAAPATPLKSIPPSMKAEVW